MSKIYFDNAATTPISNDVVEIMYQVMKNNFGNLYIFQNLNHLKITLVIHLQFILLVENLDQLLN